MLDRNLFLNLQCFSATGGIEKLCRIVSKALFDFSLTHKSSFDIYSLHDSGDCAYGNKYIPAERFKGFGGSYLSFIIAAISSGRKAHAIILSHINLLPVGWLIKKLSPKTKLLLYAHGIEIWEIPLGYKKHLLSACDQFLCVSNYTRDKMINLHNVSPEKCKVLNNCLDPFLPAGNCLQHFPDLRSRFGIADDQKLLFTLARMNAKERYKGYDKIIKMIPDLKKEFTGIKYMIGGKADADELNYVKELIRLNGVEEDVIIAGYIPGQDLPSFYQMADIFIMPSYNEGFGISFIEALYFGLPVITGNCDGSTDVMVSETFGRSANPFSEADILNTIKNTLQDIPKIKPDISALIDYFSFQKYKNKLTEFIESN